MIVRGYYGEIRGRLRGDCGDIEILRISATNVSYIHTVGTYPIATFCCHTNFQKDGKMHCDTVMH